MSHLWQSRLVNFTRFFLSWIPFSLAFWAAKQIGSMAYFLMPRRRKIALDNLAIAFGNHLDERQKRNIAHTAFENAALSLVELFMVERVIKSVHQRFTVKGEEHLRSALDKGRGVIIVVSHLGSWEYLAFAPYLTQTKWSVAVKDIRNPFLNTLIDRLRRVMTVQPIPKVNSARPMLKELKDNHAVAILVDQWAGGEGVWIDFFGQKTSTTTIPSRFAKKTGCVLLPAYCLRTRFGHYEIQFDPEIPFNSESEQWEMEITADINRRLEEKIRQYPEQWLWGHRRWKSKPTLSALRGEEAFPDQE